MMIVMEGRKGRKWKNMRQQRRTNEQTNLVNETGREKVRYKKKKALYRILRAV